MILCAYSGLSQEEYDRLSQIAPTVPYKERPWQTTWRDQTIENAAALGLEAEGKALVEDMDALIAGKLEAYPQIVGKHAAFCWIDASDMSTFYIYLNTDPRAAYLEDLGLAVPDSVKALTENAEDFSITVSREETMGTDLMVLSGITRRYSSGFRSLRSRSGSHPRISDIPAASFPSLHRRAYRLQ